MASNPSTQHPHVGYNDEDAVSPVLGSRDLAQDVVITTRSDYRKAQSGTRRGGYLNQYEFLERLGKGQHGEVWRARDHKKAGFVAIKAVRRKNPKTDRMKQLRKKNLPTSPHVSLTDNVSDTELKIRKEIAIMKKCRHPHVVRLWEVIDDKLSDKIYMVMEYLAGGEIKWRTPADEPSLRADQTRRICRDVILGLEYLHHQGIIHRDIKPANLLWTADRRMVKIADFGVSHFSYAQRFSAAGQGDARDEDPILMNESDLSKFAGTPNFLAPEIVTDSGSTTESSTASSLNTLGTYTPDRRRSITKAIDIWALGVTLYGLLFGELPFRADSEYQIYSLIRTDDWSVPDSMGVDKIPVGGRYQEEPREGAETEGYLAVSLLEGLLKKDAGKRITLDQVKRHPWILYDLGNPDAWLRQSMPNKAKSLAPTEDETSSAISSVRFRWSNSRLARGLSSLFRNVRQQRSTRFARTRQSVDDLKSDKVGTRSAPHVTLSRHRSSGAVLTHQRDKTKQPMSHHQQYPQQPQQRLISPKTGSSRNKSTADVTNTTSIGVRLHGQQLNPQKTFEPFAMWADGSGAAKSSPNISGSGPKPRRGSLPSQQALGNLQVPARVAPSRVGSPQPPTPYSASASTSASQTSSPVTTDTQVTPSEERPRSRLSMSWITSKLFSSKASYGPSSHEASTSTIASTSPVRSTSVSKQDRDLHGRQSEDAFHRTNAVSRKSSGSEPFSINMRAASWGDVGGAGFRPSDDRMSLYSGDRPDDAVDQETMLLGAGGIAQSPVLSVPSGALSTVSSSASLGQPAWASVQVLRPDSTVQEPAIVQRHAQYRPVGHTTSPLSQPSFSQGELAARRRSSYSSSYDDDSLNDGQRTPSELDYNLQPSTSQRYHEEDEESDDEDDDEDSEENIRLEVRTRRPSVTITEASPPHPPPPQRTHSQRSERTMICT